MSSLRVVSVRPPLLVLSTDTRRYLFGCPEGTQRLAVEHRVRLLKLRAICASQFPVSVSSSRYTGLLGVAVSEPGHDFMGLPGLLLTLSDMQRCDGLALLGPENAGRLVRVLQRALRRPPFPVEVAECPAGGGRRVDFEDLSVTCLCPGEGLVCYLCETPSLPGKFDSGSLSFPTLAYF